MTGITSSFQSHQLLESKLPFTSIYYQISLDMILATLQVMVVSNEFWDDAKKDSGFSKNNSLKFKVIRQLRTLN